MKKLLAVVFVCLSLAGGAFWWHNHRRWVADEPRREALAAAARFGRELRSPDGKVRDCVVVPGAYLSRTPQEQEDFVRKALRDEISAEGLEILSREGDYGPLAEVFPDNGSKWAKQFGVDAEDCVAFKTVKGNLIAELVLHNEGTRYRILRCNNVKQLAIE